MNLINKHSKVLLAGDSWGCGEWSWDAKQIQHLGLELYLREYGCEVTNVSFPGCSNLYSITALKKQLVDNTYDVILWIQTDPTRDIRPYEDNADKFALPIDDFLKLQDELIDKSYQSLNQLGPTIFCMGGCSKIKLPIINKYPNLNPIIPSIIEFFGCEDMPLWVPGSRWLHDLGITLSESIVDYMYENVTKWERAGEHRFQLDYYLDKKWFFPDGHHTNRHAHQKIFEYLIDFKLPD
jgi:hypothetical protein